MGGDAGRGLPPGACCKRFLLGKALKRAGAPLWAPAESELVALEGAAASLLEVQGETDVEEVHIEIEVLYPHSLVNSSLTTGENVSSAA